MRFDFLFISTCVILKYCINCRKRPTICMVKTVSIDLNEMPREGRSDSESNTNANGRDHVNISYFSYSLNTFKWTQFFSHQIALEIITDFCENSTIHGIHYFTEPKRHWVERYGLFDAKKTMFTCINVGASFAFL